MKFKTSVEVRTQAEVPLAKLDVSLSEEIVSPDIAIQLGLQIRSLIDRTFTGVLVYVDGHQVI